VGFAFVHGRHTDDFLDSPSATIGPDFSSSVTFGLSGSIAEVGRPTIRFTKATRESRENTGALLLGFEADIDVVNRIALVHEIRAIALRTGPGGMFLIRPGVGVRWKF
jgi:hypothetical protein